MGAKSTFKWDGRELKLADTAHWSDGGFFERGKSAKIGRWSKPWNCITHASDLVAVLLVKLGAALTAHVLDENVTNVVVEYLFGGRRHADDWPCLPPEKRDWARPPVRVWLLRGSDSVLVEREQVRELLTKMLEASGPKMQMSELLHGGQVASADDDAASSDGDD
jgi:hypothetical protein